MRRLAALKTENNEKITYMKRLNIIKYTYPQSCARTRKKRFEEDPCQRKAVQTTSGNRVEKQNCDLATESKTDRWGMRREATENSLVTVKKSELERHRSLP